jgi:hypothetical protein
MLYPLWNNKGWSNCRNWAGYHHQNHLELPIH